jgi:linoleoyl-CoA desaturase
LQLPKFSSINPGFHQELKQRVQQYFVDKNLSMNGNTALLVKAVIFVTLYVGLFLAILLINPPIWLGLILSVLLGISIAGIGFNIMHDGVHGSISKNPFVNKIAGWTLNICGGSVFMWNMKHNVIHHAYTNVEGVDDDIENQPWLRMSPTQKKYWLHRFQHIYFVPLYAVLHLFWIFFLDFQKYFRQKVGNIPLKKMSTKDHFIFWSSKLTYIAVFIILPMFIIGPGKYLLFFLTATLVAGFILSIVFQLAHTVEHTNFVSLSNDQSRIATEWAIHQIQTTANFAMSNKFVSWMVGGLNFQIEHHLFPKISHVHYPAISKIVRQICDEYGVNYIAYPKTRMAIASHVNYLRLMGR